jgi:hypothetical protein
MTTLRFVQHPWLSDHFTTTDDKPVVSEKTSFEVPVNATGRIKIAFVAKDIGLNTITGEVGHRFKNINGILMLPGSLSVHEEIDGDAVLKTITVDVVATNGLIRPRVAGITSKTIEWLLDVRYWAH